ncbi:MAG: hypothetical protein HKN71_09300 [Gemmatimonadetes bacterium]|nr:hypothetical protein [Gemmatimonadota bacterium]
MKVVTAILRWATGRRVLQSILVAAAGGFVLFRFGPYAQVSSVAGPLPEETVSTRSDLHGFLGELGEGGRELYATFQLWDFLNPLLLGFLSVAVVGWLIGRSRLGSGRNVAVIIPFVAPIADALENVVLLLVIAAFPADPWIGGLFPLVTSVKFMGLAATLLLSLALSVLAIRRRGEGREP